MCCGRWRLRRNARNGRNARINKNYRALKRILKIIVYSREGVPVAGFFFLFFFLLLTTLTSNPRASWMRSEPRPIGFFIFFFQKLLSSVCSSKFFKRLYCTPRRTTYIFFFTYWSFIRIDISYTRPKRPRPETFEKLSRSYCTVRFWMFYTTVW